MVLKFIGLEIGLCHELGTKLDKDCMYRVDDGLTYMDMTCSMDWTLCQLDEMAALVSRKIIAKHTRHLY